MEENIPDVTVYRLDEAINILEKERIKFKLKKTAPPFSSTPNHQEKTISPAKYRVVKQCKLEDNIVELTVVFVE